MNVVRFVPWGALCLVAGCFSPNSELTDDMPEPIPPSDRCGDTEGGSDTEGCESSSSSSTQTQGSSDTGALFDACTEADDCNGDDVCAASWDAEAGERTGFECRFICVPTLDETAWCADDEACCAADARCTARGYCVVE